MTGTIFKNSNLPLQKWFWTLYVVKINKKKISGYQLSGEIDVTPMTSYSLLREVESI